ncbi:MAG: hypothetical protein WC383_11680 [Gammaproteobacteria bacterium]
MDGRSWPRLARVTAVHPEAHTVDIEYLSDPGTATHVPVLVGVPVSTNTGLSGLPVPAGGPGSGYTGVRDITAVVDLVDGVPVVVGFLHQRVSQMLFKDKERMVYRHASDFYMTVDKDGNLEVFHPSGTYLRIGESPGHEDLTGKDFDGRWKIEKNIDKAPYVRLRVANAGMVKTTLTIAPTGDVTLDTHGKLTVTADGDTHVTTPR